MGFHGSGWWSFLGSPEEKPKVTWHLLKRIATALGTRIELRFLPEDAKRTNE
jgi:hypothetical protein